jgi:hypothetical protein
MLLTMPKSKTALNFSNEPKVCACCGFYGDAEHVGDERPENAFSIPPSSGAK